MTTLVKKTLEELQVDCEVASEVLAECLAFCAKELAQERAVESPNLEKIEALETEARELKQQEMAIGVENTQVVHKALYFTHHC